MTDAAQDALEGLDQVAPGATARKTLDLADPAILETGTLALLRQILCQPQSLPSGALAVTDCVATADGAAAMRFSGTFAGLPFADACPVAGRLFDLAATDARRAERHCVLAVTLPAGLDPVRFFAPYSQVPASVGPYLSGGGDNPFLKKLAFTDRTLIVSSLDLGSDLYADVPVPIEIGDFAPRPALQAGLHFKVEIDVADGVTAALRALSLSGTFPLTASILSGDRGLSLRAMRDYAPAVSLDLSGFKLGLSTISLDFLLASLGEALPVVALRGATSFGSTTVPVAATLDMAAELLWVATTQAFDLPSLDDLARLLGLPSGVASHLPASAAGYGTFSIQSLSFSVGLNPTYVYEAAFVVTTEKAVPLLDNVIAVTPILGLRILCPLDAANRAEEVVLAGHWLVGGTTFDVVLSMADQTLSADMARGETLDVATLLDKVLPGVKLPSDSIELMDLELSASWADKTFEAAIDVATDWVFEVAGASFGVYDLALEVAYAESKVTDCVLTGRLDLAGLELDATATFEAESGWLLHAGTVPDEAISLAHAFDALRKDLNGIAGSLANVPDDYLDVALSDVVVEYQPTGRMTVNLGLAHTLQIAPGFSVDKLFVAASIADHSIQGSLTARLTVAGIRVFLDCKKQGTSLTFSGSTGDDQEVPLGQLVEDLASKLGIAPPVTEHADLGGLALRDIGVTFAQPGDQLAVKAAIKDRVAIAGSPQWALDAAAFSATRGPQGLHAAITGALDLAGQRVAIAADYASAEGWHFIGAANALSLGAVARDLAQKLGVALNASVADAVMLDTLSVELWSLSPRLKLDCTGHMTVLHQPIAMKVDLDIRRGDAGSPTSGSTVFTGIITIAHAPFTIDFTSVGSGQTFVARWQDAAHPLDFTAVAAFFGLDVGSIPGKLLPSLIEASFTCDTARKELAFTATTENVAITFVSMAPVAAAQGSAWDHVLTLDARHDIGLDSVPLLGPALSRAGGLKIDVMRLLDASRAFSAAEVAALHAFSGADSLATVQELSVGQKWLLSLASATPGGFDAGDFLRGLASDLGITLPNPLVEAARGLKLASLTVAINVTTKAFSIVAATADKRQLAIGPASHALDASLDVSSLLDAKTGQRTIEARFEADLVMGAARFVIDLDIGQGAVVTGRWTSLRGETLGLSDIAAALGVTSPPGIPDGLDLALTSAVFEYREDKQVFTLSAVSRAFGDAFVVVAKGTDGTWGLVFGVDCPRAGKLSDLPVVGGNLRAVDFVTVEKSAFLLSSSTFSGFVVPSLPPLPVAGDDATRPASGRTVTPVAAGAPLQLSPGLSLAAAIDLTAAQDRRFQHLRSIVDCSTLSLQVATGPSSLSLVAALPGSVAIPAGGKSSLRLGNAYVTIVATPEVAFELSGSLAFTVNGTPVAATAKLVLAETEAQVLVTLSASQVPLPGPPGVKGLHFGEFGIEMGVFFEPPGIDLGLQGKVRIGQDQSLQADQFALVLEMVEEVPNVLYLAFYIDQLDLGQVVTLFTDVSSSALTEQLQVVKASGLAFHWCENVVPLPDGTLAQPGFGFEGAIRIFSFEAHAKLDIGAPKGMSGTAEMAPIQLGNILHVAGAGKGITRNYQDAGNGKWTEVDNTRMGRQTPPLPTRRDVVIAPGGPVIAFNTTQSPYLLVGLDVTLFDLVHAAVSATISGSGFSFTLVYALGSLEKFEMHCVLAGTDHFSAGASLALHLDASVGPLRIAGASVGSIHLVADMQAATDLTLTPSEFRLNLSGRFSFEGLTLTMPTLTISVAPASLKTLPGEAIKQIQAHASELFQALVADVGRWADMIGRGVITGVDDMAATLKTVYHKTAQEAAALMRQAKKGVAVVASGLKSAYGASSDAAAVALKGAGYGASEVASGLKSGYALSTQDIAKALKTSGYAASQVGDALKSACGASAQQAANALKGAGYVIGDVGDALKSSFGATAQTATSVLRGAGYTANDVAGSLRHSYGVSADAAAKALASAGYRINEVGGALKDGFGATSGATATALRGAGYAVNDTGNFIKSAYGLGDDQMRSALQGAGYAADQVHKAFDHAGSAISGVAGTAGRGIVDVGNKAGNVAKSGWNSFKHLF